MTISLTGIRMTFWSTLCGIYLQVFGIILHVMQLNHLPQLGVHHNSRLRMEGHSGTKSLPVDNMGPW